MSRAILILICFAIPVSAAEKRPMTIDDLYRFQRVSDPQISPDGTQVVYVIGNITNPAKNGSQSNLWRVPTQFDEPGGTPRKAPRQLTTTDKKDSHPRWSPDSKHILFESSRSGGENQLWIIDVGGGEAKQLTHVSTGANNGIWSRDGSHIAFVSAVFPENSEKPFAESDKLNKQRMEEENGPVKARATNKLFWRHWNSYVEGKRQHLFVMKADGSDVRDVTPGDRDAFPTSDTFSSGDNFTFSPDSSFLVFTAVPAKDEAWSTNYDICRVSIDNKTRDWECLTKNNPAADGAPAFSPDGTKLAYRAQRKPGYEADKWQLMVVNCKPNGTFDGQSQSVTQDWNLSVEEFVWSCIWGDEDVFMTADDRAQRPIFRVSLRDLSAIKPPEKWPEETDFKDAISAGTYSSLNTNNSGIGCVFLRSSIEHPSELWIGSRGVVSATQKPVVCTVKSYAAKANDTLLSELDRPVPEPVTVPVEGGNMQMWILKPPGFDPAKKWPVAFLVHGGPQGAWEDGWSYRWCPELWAAQGYVVALPNPRGSTGFGQKFVEEISGDWGGKCYDDLMKGADYVAALPYVDKDRMIAAGASFGGYMMNWFAVNTGCFKALVSHDGVYNFDSMYGTTDEVWFDEFEHGGPPWGKNRNSYEKHSPHRLAANLGKFKTPILVIQNDLDFRCPIGQGIELFTALQRQGVPSRFLNFPDEGHWVLKPANSKRWHQEVFGWITKYCPPGGR